MKKQKGSALIIVLISTSIMLLMTYVLGQLITSQQKTLANSIDLDLAQNYANIALMQGESQAYLFDLKMNNLESMPNAGSCDSAFQDLKNVFTDINDLNAYKNIANCESIKRIWEINHNYPNFIKEGNLCNSKTSSLTGFCYNRLANDYSFNSNSTWQPWLVTAPAGASNPCLSITNKNISLLDASDDNGVATYAKNIEVYNSSICANPRVIIEPINLDFRGTYIANYIESDGVANQTFESDLFTQPNGTQMLMYKMNIESNTIYGSGNERSPAVNSGRLYRITARGYGKSGKNQITIQEIVLINGFADDEQNPRIKTGDHPLNLAYRIVRLSIRHL